MKEIKGPLPICNLVDLWVPHSRSSGEKLCYKTIQFKTKEGTKNAVQNEYNFTKINITSILKFKSLAAHKILLV